MTCLSHALTLDTHSVMSLLVPWMVRTSWIKIRSWRGTCTCTWTNTLCVAEQTAVLLQCRWHLSFTPQPTIHVAASKDMPMPGAKGGVFSLSFLRWYPRSSLLIPKPKLLLSVPVIVKQVLTSICMCVSTVLVVVALAGVRIGNISWLLLDSWSFAERDIQV